MAETNPPLIDHENETEEDRKRTVLPDMIGKNERLAERMMKQHIEGNGVDEWHIQLKGNDMKSYEYDLTIKKEGWEDYNVVTLGNDVEQFGDEAEFLAYIRNIEDHCRMITANAITEG